MIIHFLNLVTDNSNYFLVLIDITTSITNVDVMNIKVKNEPEHWQVHCESKN